MTPFFLSVIFQLVQAISSYFYLVEIGRDGLDQPTYGYGDIMEMSNVLLKMFIARFVVCLFDGKDVWWWLLLVMWKLWIYDGDV